MPEPTGRCRPGRPRLPRAARRHGGTRRLTAGSQPGHTDRSAGGAKLSHEPPSTAGRRPNRGDTRGDHAASQRILVVDDEPSIVDAVATSLRYEGFEVTEAVNGRLALAAAQEDPPDLIVLDVMLPDLDGLEVTRRLRADGHPGARPLPHRPRRGGRQGGRASPSGGDDYVTKPFALAEVIARVHAILRRTRRRARGRRASCASPTSRWTRTPTR